MIINGALEKRKRKNLAEFSRGKDDFHLKISDDVTHFTKFKRKGKQSRNRVLRQ